ncbi:MAG: trypsin-like peptidase domain-containing protein [Gammaproteobacteria bacterium]
MDLANTATHKSPARTLAGCCGAVLAVLSFALLADPRLSVDPFTRGWDAFESGEYHTALDYWLPLAKQGDPNAQLNIGLMYDTGRGLAVDTDQAVYWYRQSAENGLAAAQFNLGLMYRDGQGVEQDTQLASSWLERAAAQGLQAARDLLETGLHMPASLESTQADRHEFLDDLDGASTGTGWAVAGGYVVTSEHVVTDVPVVALYDTTGKRYQAQVVLRDVHNDIALLRIEGTQALPPALALAPGDARAGIDVFTLGFPRVDILGRTPKLSIGIISAVNGYRDDPASYQTSVQIQPGNSGGPLLNMNGEVVGIMAAMLGDQSGTSQPQPGLSYAVKAEKIHAALQSLPPAEIPAHPLPVTPAGLADLAERVQGAVMLVVATQ